MIKSKIFLVEVYLFLGKVIQTICNEFLNEYKLLCIAYFTKELSITNQITVRSHLVVAWELGPFKTVKYFGWNPHNLIF